MGKFLPWRWLPVGALLALLACGGSGGGTTGPPDPTGTWQVTVGPDPRFTMEVTASGDGYAFELFGADIPIAGAATPSGSGLVLEADLPGMGTFEANAVYAPDGRSFAGDWEIPEAPASGTLTGMRDPWPTWDLDTAGVPAIGAANRIDLDPIERLSRFRSGAGHDYSDDFESCRSMKHYFDPYDGVDMSTIRIHAPFAGTVVGTTEEWDGPTTWKGTAVGIRPLSHPAIHVVLFHVDLHQPLPVGATVSAGQELGTSEKDDGTAADVAFGVMTPAGFRLVSWFEVMTNDVFAAYAARGVGSRTDLIVTRAQRDADSLTCDGQQFLTTSSLPDWIDQD